MRSPSDGDEDMSYGVEKAVFFSSRSGNVKERSRIEVLGGCLQYLPRLKTIGLFRLMVKENHAYFGALEQFDR